ncbi:hypothetical protein JOE21_002557 [Desmospora profundinema]|uniref:Uncharacterized protein n=1 Tax=Desmospora profundinema TaxID=1571184 RepID=A0ABU1IP33_9BACL|nr:hypothetical protein [Desmospora profundinema]
MAEMSGTSGRSLFQIADKPSGALPCSSVAGNLKRGRPDFFMWLNQPLNV